ncbi:MAG: hypothetical protein GY858_00955 [Candidatus Omnitrophica bacterium]|nr:hypothetical protein [Candidatus Omnitrophota bacterium]
MNKKLIIIALFLLPIFVFSQTNNISLDVKSMDIIDVLKILADQGEFNISVSGDVRGRVTLFLKDVNVKDALEIALVSASLAYEQRGEITYIMTDREYETKYGKKYGDNKKVKAFKLKYAKALNVRELLIQAVSGVGKVIMDTSTDTIIVIDTEDNIKQMEKIITYADKPVKTKVFQLDYALAEEVEPKIKELLTPLAELTIDQASNKIIIRDYPDKLKKIEELISAIDEKPLQVLINAKIVEIRPSEKFYSGVNWEYWIDKYFRVDGDFAISSPSATTDKARFGTIGTTVSEGGDYTGIIDFLEIFGETKILSSPRILALNNKEAKILVGTKDVYITSTTSQVGDSAVVSQAVNFVDVGVKLFVTPTINRSGDITLQIKPEISSSERMDITSDDKITEIPVVTTSEAETTVMVKDGVSIIIGGLRKITHEKERKQVPILGSIPLLGAAFRSKKDEQSESELVILLTPQIVSGENSTEEELDYELNGDMGEGETKSQF